MSNVVPLPAPRPCAICGKPADKAFRPFCSARCKDVDLYRWLGGHYKVETNEPAAPAGAGRREEDED